MGCKDCGKAAVPWVSSAGEWFSARCDSCTIDALRAELELTRKFFEVSEVKARHEQLTAARALLKRWVDPAFPISRPFARHDTVAFLAERGEGEN